MGYNNIPNSILLQRVLFEGIDLFCGGGGTSEGILKAKFKGQFIAKIKVAINHDKQAIKTHSTNHSSILHRVEDIRKTNIITLPARTTSNSIFFIWASLECTNYSKAKGGLPKDADSRTLAWDLIPYLEIHQPEYLFIENVEEFMSWGPLDENGRPVSRKAGIDYLKWVNHIKGMGYNFDYRILDSANYGAYTSRKRYFAVFAKKGLPIAWPEATHSKKPTNDMFDTRKPWKAVKDVLHLQDHGKSIFARKKPLSPNTLKRILAGLEKYVAKGENSFIKRYNGGDPKHKVRSLNLPIGTISTNNRHALVTPFFIKYFGKGKNIASLDTCAPTLTTKDRLALIQPVQSQWLDKQYSGPHNHQSINRPSGTILTNDKHSLVTTQWLLNPQYKSKGNDLDRPCFTLIARMDKAPPYLLSADKSYNEKTSIPDYLISDPCPEMTKIKKFMFLFGISDIKMRMLNVEELKLIQGFPKDYKFFGTQADIKKQIGNSVVPIIPKLWFEAIYKKLVENNTDVGGHTIVTQ